MNTINSHLPRRLNNGRVLVLKKACLVALVAAAALGLPGISQASPLNRTVVRASFYTHGVRTASGERFNPNGYTAASRTLPFGTRLHLTNPKNGRSVVVRINDRGPFVAGRSLDLARGAAAALGMIGSGTASLEVARL